MSVLIAKGTMAMLVVAISLNVAYAQEIDGLKTTRDVVKFLVEKVDSNLIYRPLIISGGEDTSKVENTKFFKIDLDGNGLTDLLINGGYVFAVLDFGKGHYGIKDLYDGKVINILRANGIPLIIFERSKNVSEIAYVPQKDSFVFKFNDFVEYNAKPEEMKVDEIDFKSYGTYSGMYATRPIFELKINSEWKAEYNSKFDYEPGVGKFISTIDSTSFTSVLQTINYLKLASLQDNYRSETTDQETLVLEVKFGDNRGTKKIRDYGASGTFGLKILYEQLKNLIKALNWVKVD